MKGKVSRLISVSLALVLLFCPIGTDYQEPFFICPSASAQVEYQGELEPGILQEVSLPWRETETEPERREATYKVVPKETDRYVFYSISDTPVTAYLLYDSGGRMDWDENTSGKRNNFSLECELTKGSTYYLQVQFRESTSQRGSFFIGMRKSIRSSMFDSALQLSGVTPKDGIEREISATGAAVYACFQPMESGYYSIYSRDFCGCQGDCQEGSGCQGDCQEGSGCRTDNLCGCLNDLQATVYIENGEEKLETLYGGIASEKSNGFLIRNYFEKGQTYYIMIMAADERKKGKFKLAVANDLSDAPVEQLEWGVKQDLLLDGSQETLFYKLLPDKDGTYRFQSEFGRNLYVTLYDKNLQKLMESNSLQDDFKEDAVLHAGQEYYLQLSTLCGDTFGFYLTGSYVSGDMTLPGGATGTGGGVSGGTGGVSGGTRKISVASLDMAAIADQAYTGKQIKPGITLRYGGYQLVQNKDYRLTYKNNKKIGNAAVTIQGIGNYSGTRTAKFRIVPKKVKIKKAKRSGKKITVKWKKLPKVTGYEVSYAYSKKMKGAKKKNAKKTSCTITLKKKKTCYIRVRAYKKVKKKKFYGSFSKVKRIKM